MKWIEIGSGEEAIAYKGALKSLNLLEIDQSLDEGRIVVKRVNHSCVESSQGHDVFCRHLAIGILEDYFIGCKDYSEKHIPCVLNSFNNGESCGYYYEFVEGSEGWPTEVNIEEQRVFSNKMNNFGIDLWHDTCFVDDARIGKNVIFKPWNTNEVYNTDNSGHYQGLHKFWKRIDFGSCSCKFDYEKFRDKLYENRDNMKKVLGRETYRILELAGKYGDYTYRQTMSDVEVLELGRDVLHGRGWKG